MVTTAPFIERPGARIGADGLLSARLGISKLAVRSGWIDLSVWGRNLTDRACVIDSVGSFPWSTNMKAHGEPLTIGVDLGFHF